MKRFLSTVMTKRYTDDFPLPLLKLLFITGENICIDGGMTRQMIYHNDFGWKLEETHHTLNGV